MSCRVSGGSNRQRGDQGGQGGPGGAMRDEGGSMGGLRGP